MTKIAVPAFLTAAALALSLALAPVRTLADDDHGKIDQLRAAVSRGEVQPLSDLLQALRAAYPGEVVDVEIDEDNGRFRYEFKVLEASGRLLDVKMDAATGRILDVEND